VGGAHGAGREQRLTLLKGRPARVRVIAYQSERAEGERAEKRYARLATDLDRFLCVGECFRPAPGQAVQLCPEDQRLGFKAPRRELFRQRQGCFSVQQRCGKIHQSMTAKGGGVVSDHFRPAVRDPKLAETVKLPTIEDAVNAGGFLAGRPEDIIEALKAVERRYPGLDRVICATQLDVQLEDLDRFAKEVIPAFRDTRTAAAAQ
jgi:hypothetical protein